MKDQQYRDIIIDAIEAGLMIKESDIEMEFGLTLEQVADAVQNGDIRKPVRKFRRYYYFYNDIERLCAHIREEVDVGEK